MISDHISTPEANIQTTHGPPSLASVTTPRMKGI